MSETSGTRTITIRPGDPCPWCEKAEPHETSYRSGERPECGPTETDRHQEEARRFEWVANYGELAGLEHALALGNFAAIEERAAELRAALRPGG